MNINVDPQNGAELVGLWYVLASEFRFFQRFSQMHGWCFSQVAVFLAAIQAIHLFHVISTSKFHWLSKKGCNILQHMVFYICSWDFNGYSVSGGIPNDTSAKRIDLPLCCTAVLTNGTSAFRCETGKQSIWNHQKCMKHDDLIFVAIAHHMFWRSRCHVAIGDWGNGCPFHDLIDHHLRFQSPRALQFWMLTSKLHWSRSKVSMGWWHPIWWIKKTSPENLGISRPTIAPQWCFQHGNKTRKLLCSVCVSSSFIPLWSPFEISGRKLRMVFFTVFLSCYKKVGGSTGNTPGKLHESRETQTAFSSLAANSRA